jgi:hypothetical protein
MTTLVGRECWHVDSGTLLHGRISSQWFDPDICGLLLDNGETRHIASQSAILSLDAAIDACSQKIEIWKSLERQLCQEWDARNSDGAAA